MSRIDLNRSAGVAMASQLKSFLTASCITRYQLATLIDTAVAEEDHIDLMREAAACLYDHDGEHAAPYPGLSRLANFLQDAFGFELDEAAIPRTGQRVSAFFAQLFGVLLCVSTLYVVLGGIAAGESALTSSFSVPIWATCSILLMALLLLGSLEGTQIAIVALTDKKVAAFKKQYPRGCRAIKPVQTRIMVQRYLAGRQFFVIFVVFVIAQVTSFPSMEMLPFTDVSIQSLPEVVIFRHQSRRWTVCRAEMRRRR